MNDAVAGDTVLVDDGTYQEEVVIDKAIKVTSVNGRDFTTIKGFDLFSSSWAVEFTPGSKGAVMDGFTITGQTYYTTSGVLINGSPTLSNCEITDNAGINGGGLVITGGSPRIDSCIFSNNYGQSGGGVYAMASSPTFTGCDFTDNTSTRGGGAYISTDADVTFVDCTFTDNTASAITYSGGGIVNHGTMTMSASTVSRNTATEGGGIVAGLGSTSITTSNHIHLLVVDGEEEAIPKSLQLVAGKTAQE